MENFRDYAKNLYVIKRELSDLKRLDYGHFEYRLGRFTLKIFTHRIQDAPVRNENDRITHHEKVDVALFEAVSSKLGIILTDSISLSADIRFKDYQPIKYGGYNGELMPISHLCELIKYLHRLNNLTAFI